MNIDDIHKIRGLDPAKLFRTKVVLSNLSKILNEELPLNESDRGTGKTELIISEAILNLYSGKCVMLVCSTVESGNALVKKLHEEIDGFIKMTGDSLSYDRLSKDKIFFMTQNEAVSNLRLFGNIVVLNDLEK